MSCVTLRLISEDGWVAPYPRQREAFNAWGFAPAIWDTVALACGLNKAWMRTWSAATGKSPELDLICAEVYGDRLDERLRLLLAATFDRVWVRRDGFAPLAEALRWLYTTHLGPQGIADTALRMADHLDDLRYHPGLLGVGIDATSVNDTWWNQRIPLGVDGLPLTGNGVRADYDYRPMNIFENPNASDGKPHLELIDYVRWAKGRG